MDRQELYNNINQKLAADDIEGAVDLAEVGLALGETHPMLLNLCAYRLEVRGDFAGSLKLLDQALQISPEDVTILSAIGHNWLKQAAPRNALRSFSAALARAPGFAPAHHGAGLALWALGDMKESRTAQARAAALDPNYPDPRGALALLALHERKPHEARAHANAALRLNPREPAAFLTLATLDQEAGDHAAVAARLQTEIRNPQIAPLQRAPLCRLLGDALDSLGEFDAAFAAYHEGNTIQRLMFAPQHGGDDLESAVGLCERITREFKAEAHTFPTPHVLEGPDVNHVFLLGFPRSGTTLLEQVLASHPDVVALEEKPTLNDDITAFFLEQDSLETLMNLDEAEIASRVAAYWERIAGYGLRVEGKTFVDKQPSMTIYLPLIAKLFPRARIIVARRDPRDVVLSCYRRGFNMNRTIYEFTDLERLATLYAATMELAELYFDKLPLKFHVHSHEAMIADFDGRISALCDSLGLDFDENMRNFVETAKARDIRTPSAGQVVQGLNASGVGYWRNYETHLAPACAILEPWIQRYGYA